MIGKSHWQIKGKIICKLKVLIDIVQEQDSHDPASSPSANKKISCESLYERFT
jgi:hypothetical protein